MIPDHDSVPEGQTGTGARKSWKADLASWGGDGGGTLFKVVTMVMVVILVMLMVMLVVMLVMIMMMLAGDKGDSGSVLWASYWLPYF